jgi:NAD(P)-dependent dehydrogenase (short-subunit alcohol dehydrogenase family)
MGMFDGQVVLVTGGATGIGRSISETFANEGALVSIVDIDAQAGNSAISQIHSTGGKAILVESDLGNTLGCKEAVIKTVSNLGSIDVLVNNVGIQGPASYTNVEDTSEKMWDRIITVNLKSYFLMAKYCIPEIRKRGGGAIINIASVQGLQSQKLVPAYAASKGGILSLTRQLSLDYADENIRVVAINPGTIDTEMVRSMAKLEDGTTDDTLAQWGKGHPLGRIGTGLDVANVVLFLSSEKASFITGEYVNVDGGYMASGAWSS